MTDKKNGRPKGSTTGQSYESIIREISTATNLKPDIVRSVMKSWTDIFIRDVILYGKFHWPRSFSVRTKVRPEHRGYNPLKQEYEIRPETQVLQMSISRRVRSFWRWKIRNKRNAEHGVTKDNWKSWYDKKDNGSGE